MWLCVCMYALPVVASVGKCVTLSVTYQRALFFGEIYIIPCIAITVQNVIIGRFLYVFLNKAFIFSCNLIIIFPPNFS